MSKNNAFVKFEKVDKSYDGKLLVVKDLNLDIAEGEFITMLGPSGSGKTTCLMLVVCSKESLQNPIVLSLINKLNIECAEVYQTQAFS